MTEGKTAFTKSSLIAWRQCPRRFWLQSVRPELAKEDPSSQSRLSDGIKIGEIARGLYPNGTHIETLNQNDAVAKTLEALKHLSNPIFEAAFIASDVLIRVDLLVPDGDSFRLIEVKSNTSIKDYHFDDIAIQTWVMQSDGITPTRISLAHINNEFIYPGNSDYRDLFIEIDLTIQIKKLASEVPQWIEAAKKTLNSKNEPTIAIGRHCTNPYACHFQAHCSAAESNVDYPINILPNAPKLVGKLQSDGYRDLREVPVERLSNPRHIRMHRACLSGKAELDPKAIETIKSLAYPRYYLDFETIAFPVPNWIGTRPYKQIPFQWSCHIEHYDGTFTHAEFLDTSGSDPRLEFSKSLINILGSNGPIIVYNASFEQARMKELATDFPVFSAQILLATSRLFDLLPLARENYYHPAMLGSWSIKSVLPTIAEINYDHLTVSNGGMAQAAYLKLIGSPLSENEKTTLKNSLLDYCRQDTYAMVCLIKKIINWIY